MLSAAAAASTLPERVVALAASGVSVGSGKVKFLAAVTVLGVIGLAIGSLPGWGERAKSDESPTVTASASTGSPAAPATGRFADATAGSGLEAMLREHAARFPVWYPSRATLLDIDGDDELDLHLAGQADGSAALGHNRGGRLA